MSVITSALALTTMPQKLMMCGLGITLFAAGTYNVIQAAENHHLSKEKKNLEALILDPKTGYVVKLTQAETNSETCKAAVIVQTAAIKSQGVKDARAIAAVQARYDTEHVARVRAENSAAAFLAHKPQGVTLQDRVLDVDAQILGDLK